MKKKLLLFCSIILSSSNSYCISNQDVYEFAKANFLLNLLRSNDNKSTQILKYCILGAYLAYVAESSKADRKTLNLLCAAGGGCTALLENRLGSLCIILSGWLGLKIIKAFVCL